MNNYPINKKYFFAIAIWASVLISSCHNYYMAVRVPKDVPTNGAATVDSLRLTDRYFILRNGSEAFYMSNIVLSADKQRLQCTLEKLSTNHSLHLIKGRGANMRYKGGESNDLLVLNEVHFYTPYDASAMVGNYTLSLNKIEKIEVIEKDRKRTTSSYVIGAVGYTLAAFAVVMVIAIATKSSCPFVSAYDGQQFTLQGEIYGGAIYPQLARHDYIPLVMNPFSDGTLRIKISNELHEHQYTDMAELWVITHDKNSKILSGEDGHLFRISNPQPPTYASLNDKATVLPALMEAGDQHLLYMDDTTTGDATNEVVMKFNTPASAKKGKLVLSLKNSYFLDLLYGELAKGFGSYYTTYIEQQRKKPTAELLKWVKEQQIPLEVSLKVGGSWKKITDLTTIGPLATRTIALQVQLPETREAVTEIKLSSGFMFWEIDYAAMDFTEDGLFDIQKITPAIATDELNKNILPELQKEDGVYLAQPDIGNMATMVYNINPLYNEAQTRTYILHSKGYYEHLRDFKTKPDIHFLNQFKVPGAFPLFGMQLYKKITADNFNSLSKSN